ncbi:MAG: YraN family protein [Patescibacteria group bacterium]
MPKIFTSEKQKIGEMGENIAERFLVKHGFSILDRNYTKKWGELDIVAKKDNKIHFIEVKSVTHETDTSYRAEDNMHPWKMKRLSRTIQTYLLDKDIEEDIEWQVDLVLVYMDMRNKKAKIKVVSDIIL